MKDSLELLLTPLKYGKIKHRNKCYFDLIFPLVIAVLTCITIYIVPVAIPIVNSAGLIENISEVLKFLIGFYITALAVISTFTREGLDEHMAGECPELGGEKLTRRRFLSLLFGYLAFLSFGIYFIGMVTQLLAPSLTILIGNIYWYNIAKVAFLFLYIFITSKLLITSLLGLHFLTDLRINRK